MKMAMAAMQALTSATPGSEANWPRQDEAACQHRALLEQQQQQHDADAAAASFATPDGGGRRPRRTAWRTSSATP